MSQVQLPHSSAPLPLGADTAHRASLHTLSRSAGAGIPRPQVSSEVCPPAKVPTWSTSGRFRVGVIRRLFGTDVALRWAMRLGKEEMANHLAARADPKGMSGRGSPTLHIAARYGHNGVLDHLLDRIRDADGNLNWANFTLDKDGRTLVRNAAQAGPSPLLALHRHPDILDTRDAQKRFAAQDLDLQARPHGDKISRVLEGVHDRWFDGLCQAIARGDTAKVVRWLDDTPGMIDSLNRPDRNGLGPLHHAFLSNNVAMVELLLARPGIVDIPDANGKTVYDHLWNIDAGGSDMAHRLAPLNFHRIADVAGTRQPDTFKAAMKRPELASLVQRSPTLVARVLSDPALRGAASDIVLARVNTHRSLHGLQRLDGPQTLALQQRLSAQDPLDLEFVLACLDRRTDLTTPEHLHAVLDLAHMCRVHDYDDTQVSAGFSRPERQDSPAATLHRDFSADMSFAVRGQTALHRAVIVRDLEQLRLLAAEPHTKDSENAVALRAFDYAKGRARPGDPGDLEMLKLCAEILNREAGPARSARPTAEDLQAFKASLAERGMPAPLLDMLSPAVVERGAELWHRLPAEAATFENKWRCVSIAHAYQHKADVVAVLHGTMDAGKTKDVEGGAQRLLLRLLGFDLGPVIPLA